MEPTPAGGSCCSAHLLLRPQNAKCTLPETLGEPLSDLVGTGLSSLLSSLTGIAPKCAPGANLLRLNLWAPTNIQAGIISLYSTIDGKLGLAIKLNCDYVIAANASVIITGKVLGQPLHIPVNVRASDGGLVSCLVTTVTTAIPFTGCLLAGINANVDADAPINIRLGNDLHGCTGVLPALTGSLLASLGISLKVTIPVSAATLYPQDRSCFIDVDTPVTPITITVLLGQQAEGYSCSGSAPTPYPYYSQPPAQPTCQTCRVSRLGWACATRCRLGQATGLQCHSKEISIIQSAPWPSNLPQNSKCTLPDTLGRPLNTLAGDALSNLLSGLTGISRTCPAGSNLLRLNLTTHTDIDVGILSLYATADGKLGLALKLNCYYVIAANATVSISGRLLGIPLNVQVPIAVNDGGLVSCVVQTVTTAIPFTGCLLAGLDLAVNLNAPISIKLSPDMSGCTGLLPALTGALLASLGIDLKVTVPIRAATVYPVDSTCRVEPTNHIQPLTVTVMLGQPVDGFNCGSNQKTPFPFLEPLKIVGLPGLNLFQKGYVPPPRMVGSGSGPSKPRNNGSAAGPQCFQCRVGPSCRRPGWPGMQQVL